MQKADQIRIAAHAWNYAMTLCMRTLPQGAEREALVACAQRPTISNVRAVLAIGRNRPWLTLIEAALIEIALAAIENVLHEADRDHRS